MTLMQKIALGFGMLLAGFGGSGCLEEPDALAAFDCASFEVFAEHVSPLMERRCGTLDCHGMESRPMRLYGELGLRHPAEANWSGGDGTTEREREDNYYSVCSVEPEKISQVANDPGGRAVNRLLLVLKARGQEGHKGGKVFNAFDDADLCVVGWLRGDNEASVEKACEAALSNLP